MTAWTPRKGFWLFFLIFNLLALPLLFFINHQIGGLRAAAAAKALPVYGALRPFSVRDIHGRTFGPEQMKNRLWILNFMFTHCPNECPAMNFKMGLLQESLPTGTGLASFSVDPEKDTPEVLAGYAERFKAREGTWYFLTGDRRTVGGLLEDCHFAQADDPLMHALRLVLVDGEGRVRGYYDYSDEVLVKKLRHDIKSLKEKG